MTEAIMTIVNLTPHTVRLNDGREYPPSGQVARMRSSYEGPDAAGCYVAVFGDVTGLPAPTACTLYVVSGMVASAVKRADVVSPATGHPDCVRQDGQVWSVPGWVRAT